MATGSRGSSRGGVSLDLSLGAVVPVERGARDGASMQKVQCGRRVCVSVCVCVFVSLCVCAG